MSWLQLSLKTNNDSVDKVSDALTTLGAVSVTLEDAEDQPLLEPKPGETPLWHNITLTALFEMGNNPLKLQQALLALDIGEVGELKFETLEDQDWERAWLDQFKAMPFGKRLWVCPSTESPPDPNGVNILLDPGLAFGTGTHPTTALCLAWLDEVVEQGQTIVDYGCGSGILSIAAFKLGCRRALAIDNDPQALTATEENAKRNHIALSQLSIKLNTEMSAPNKTDLLIANILANPLIELAPKLIELLKPGGKIALSGILSEQAQAVQKTYTDLGITLNPIKTKENWCLLSGVYMAS